MTDTLDAGSTGIALIELARLNVSAQVSQPDANAFADVLAYSDEPTAPAVPFDEILKADAEVDAAVAAVFAEQSQIVSPLIFTIDGTEVPSWRVLHERSRLQASIDGTVTFDFALVRRSTGDRQYTEPLGAIDQFCGSPPGLQSIDVDQIVFTSAGPRRVRLVTNGVVVASSGVIMAADGEVREFSCADARGRYAKKTIELVLPPGHGLTREEVVGKICDELGITDRAITIDDDGPTYKELQIIDSSGWSALQSYLAAINCVPAFDRSGTFVVQSVDKPDDVSVFTTKARQLVDRVEDNASNDGPTTVEVSGSAQVVHDGDGLRTETTVVEIYETFSILGAKRKYTSAAGATGANGAVVDQPAIFQLLRRIVTERTYQVDTLVFERVSTYGYRFTETEAGQQDGGSNATDYTYTVNTRLVDDNGPAVLEDYQTWRETDRIETTYNYDDTTGFLTSIVTEVFRWYVRRTHAAERVFNDPPGTYEWDYGTDTVLFNLDAVINSSPAREIFQLVARDVETFNVVDGFITEERFERQEMRARAGHTRLFNGGHESRDDTEDVRTVSSSITTYSAAGEQNAVKVTAEYDENGVTTSLVVEQLESYLPAAQKKSAVRPDATLYPNGKTASRNESQALEFRINSEKLEANRPEWVQRLSDQYLETIEEAEARGRFELARRSAVPYRYATAANALLKPAQQILLDLSPFTSRKLHLQAVTIEARNVDNRLAFVTVAEGVFYVV